MKRKFNDFNKLHINKDCIDFISIDDLYQAYIDILKYDLINHMVDESGDILPPHIKLYLDHCSICAEILKNQFNGDKYER